MRCLSWYSVVYVLVAIFTSLLGYSLRTPIATRARIWRSGPVTDSAQLCCPFSAFISLSIILWLTSTVTFEKRSVDSKIS